MATITSSDIIFATVMQRGRTIQSLQLSGLNSFAELFQKIRNAIASSSGLITLQLRNGSQGWSQRRALLI